LVLAVLEQPLQKEIMAAILFFRQLLLLVVVLVVAIILTVLQQRPQTEIVEGQAGVRLV
jgi:hypothetical protein